MYDVVHKLVLAVILSIGKWIYRRLESQYYGVFGVEFQIAISELRVSLVDYQPSSYLSYLPGAGTLRYCIVCMYRLNFRNTGNAKGWVSPLVCIINHFKLFFIFNFI